MEKRNHRYRSPRHRHQHKLCQMRRRNHSDWHQNRTMLLRQWTSDEPISECCEKSREKVPDTVWTRSMKGRTKETEQNISMKSEQVDWPYGMSENRCHKVSASALPCWQKESESKTRCISVINTVGLNTACRVCAWRRDGHGEECAGFWVGECIRSYF